MAQISRPFQVVLAAFVLFAIAWFALLHRPGSTSTGSSPAASVAPHPHAPIHGARPSAARTAHATSGAPSATHSGAATHRQSSSAAQHHVATRAATGAAVAGASHGATAAPRRTQPAHADPRSAQPARGTPTASAKSPSVPAMQATVAAELKQGKVALLLFWNPQSAADRAVHGEVLAVAHKLGRSVVVHAAPADQVDSYGSITREIQVYQTPTLLIVNPHGQVTTVTGYTDVYALEQTIHEAHG